MTTPRKLVIPPATDGVWHCISRCVRRAFIMGVDDYSGKDYSHRKDWVRNRIKFLTKCFGINVGGYSIMGNHTHLILEYAGRHTSKWSSEDVARRWLMLYPRRRDSRGRRIEPTESEIQDIASDAGLLATYQERLSSISWFMKSLNEWISKKANREDGVTGAFWEGRFKSTALKDQAAILTCMQYIDLNPIRAELAETPEESISTSIHERIEAREAKVKLKEFRARQFKFKKNKKEREEIQKIVEKLEAVAANANWLSSMKRTITVESEYILNMDLDEYIELIDWTGRQIANGKNGSIPANLSPILERLELRSESWLETMPYFGSHFYYVAGSLKHMVAAAKAMGKKWLKGKSVAKTAFR